MKLPRFERAAEDLARADQLLLAHDLVEGAWPDPVREWSGSGGCGGRRGIEEIHGGIIRRVWYQASAAGRSRSEVMRAVTLTPRRSSSAGSAR